MYLPGNLQCLPVILNCSFRIPLQMVRDTDPSEKIAAHSLHFARPEPLNGLTAALDRLFESAQVVIADRKIVEGRGNQRTSAGPSRGSQPLFEPIDRFVEAGFANAHHP